MVTKEQIERINELAKKQKGNMLTDEEKKEQEKLRRIYVDSFKENLKAQLKNIKIVSPEEYGKNKSEDKCTCGHDHDHDHDCNCGNHKH
jgi:uncharacterized protein YnzC (UPF0291/DUF896 family)